VILRMPRMAGFMGGSPDGALERFTEKWNPVFGHEARQTKNLARQSNHGKGPR